MLIPMEMSIISLENWSRIGKKPSLEDSPGLPRPSQKWVAV